MQRSMPELVQALMQMGLPQAEIISALLELQLKREAAARAPPSRPLLTGPTTQPVQQQTQSTTSSAAAIALQSPSGNANAMLALQSSTTSAPSTAPAPSRTTAVVRPVLQPLQPAHNQRRLKQR